MNAHDSSFEGRSSASSMVAVSNEIVKYIRDQRHDFMNSIQVIWGYLQLDRPVEAKKYITQLIKELEVYSRIFSLDNPVLSLFLYDRIKEVRRFGIEVDFETELEHLNINVLECNYREKIDLMDKLFEEVVKNILSNDSHKLVYIDFFTEDDKLYIVFSNNRYDDLYEEDNMECSADIGRETKAAVELAKKVGIGSTCLIDGDIITAKVWFHY